MNEKGYTLYIVEGDLVRKYNTEEFQKREITIGSANTDILTESNTISKVHLRINLRNDKLYFADTDSREGSFMYNNTEFQKLESMKFYKKEGQDTVIRLGNSVLVIIADNKGESEYLKANIEKGVAIGRNRESDIVLNHLGISQRHAEILPAEKGNIDMLYVYGNERTFVNGREVENEQVLRNCDYIQILNFTMIYFNSFIIYKKVFDGANVELHNITKKSMFGKKLLDDVSLRIDSNDFTAVVGGENAGRSDLINVIKGSEHEIKKGDVYFNGLDLLSNIDMLKEVIGYVPKESILFDSLTLKQCMRYALKLKDYDEVQDKEFDRHIDSVLDTLGIIEYSNMQVGRLEEDVRKRADIALELLGNPSLIILDEPSLKLDDETERGLLYLLRDIARQMSKTVIISTEKIKRLELFDKIIFMGTGGKICFCGTLDEAKMFFDTESVTEIFNMIKEKSDYWSEQYRNYFTFNITPREKHKSKLKPRVHKRKQFAMYLKRNFELLFKGKAWKVLLMVILPALFGGVTYFIPSDKVQWLYALMAFSGVFMGIFNSISDISGERVIYKRECMGNLKIPVYMLAKYVPQVIYAVLQSLIMTAVMSVTTGFAGMQKFVMPDIFLETAVIMLVLITMSVSVGLFVSALVGKPSQNLLGFIISAVCEIGILWLMQILKVNFFILLAVIAVMVILDMIALKNLSQSGE